VSINDATLDAILTEVAAGTAIRTALRSHGVTPYTFYSLITASGEVGERYARAKTAGLDAVADESMDIADSCPIDKDSVAKARLQIDTRKWLLSKLAPKKYGERTVIAGDPDAPLEHHHTAALVASKLLQPSADGDEASAIGEDDGSGVDGAALPLGILGATGSVTAR
jgi:hypothetical protein